MRDLLKIVRRTCDALLDIEGGADIIDVLTEHERSTSICVMTNRFDFTEITALADRACTLRGRMGAAERLARKHERRGYEPPDDDGDLENEREDIAFCLNLELGKLIVHCQLDLARERRAGKKTRKSKDCTSTPQPPGAPGDPMSKPADDRTIEYKLDGNGMIDPDSPGYDRLVEVLKDGTATRITTSGGECDGCEITRLDPPAPARVTELNHLRSLLRPKLSN